MTIFTSPSQWTQPLVLESLVCNLLPALARWGVVGISTLHDRHTLVRSAVFVTRRSAQKWADGANTGMDEVGRLHVVFQPQRLA